MKIRLLTLSIILIACMQTVFAQNQVVYIEGHISAIETGNPAPDHQVEIGLINGLITVMVNTDENGYYYTDYLISPADSSSLLYVFTSDCEDIHHVQVFPVVNQNLYQADFEICTQFSNCKASFEYTNQPSSSPVVSFENLSLPANNTAFWMWDFGDGQTSNEFEPIHEYAQPGIYYVCLTMVDSAFGCTSISCADVWAGINQEECEAYFIWEIQDLTASFTNISTGSPSLFFWDFGDGNTSQLPNPEHTWQYPGVYMVCLSIYDSATNCQSSRCELISIGLPQECIANYTYEQVQGNTIAFTNLSEGWIDQVIWDFGDGTTSNDYNAIHTWQQAGIYHVCLAVISNMFQCQDVFCVDITVGDTVSACEAAFSFQVDSIPGSKNHYWFNDESQGENITNWYWDFGDGAVSYIQNPEYTFAESGTYNVCLTVSGTGSGGYCSDTFCQTITTPAYSNLGGQIFAGNFPINNPENINDVAQVRLFKKSGNKLSEVAAGDFHEYGYYFFLDVMQGDYVVHAELLDGSPSFMSYIPAYTGSTHSWQLAQPVSLMGTDVFDANIYMQGITVLPQSGAGIISGNLVSLDGYLTDLSEKIIFLFQQGEVVAYDYTDASGYFSFSNLPYETYSLKAEIAGLFSNTIQVSLTDFQNQSLGLNLEVSASGIFGIGEGETREFKEISVYPNPVNDFVNIELNSINNSSIICEVISSTGVPLSIHKNKLQPGRNSFIINLKDLTPGFYMLLFKSDEGVILDKKKIVKSP
ncbi:MAG: hypothetical protein CVT94_03260 [Bacteroidetes bacterium HGW-Bacteroidetes-11]|jgi:PKD repeat protein|nr:MAG: hypothetical protein CVT94_03260 [Bacteroidetes bacterium HGW-Bacteroidetes-11]